MTAIAHREGGASINLRPATPADGDAIWSILKPVFRAGDTYAIDPDISREAALTFWTGGTHASFVARRGDEALGTCYLCPNQAGGGAHVCNAGFATARAARGLGVARIMLHGMMEEARRQGFRAMQFNFVVATNLAALHIWRSEGFAEVGRLPGAFRHPQEGYVDALVLYRHL